MPQLKILIVGCSIAGPTLASFLLLSPGPAQEKPQITILERSTEFRKAGQNVDIRGAGVTVMRKLGIESLVRGSTTGEEGVQFVDANNRIKAAFAADKTGMTSTPTSDIEILRGRLAEICWQRSRSVSADVQKKGGSPIEYIFGDTLDSLDQDGSHVHVRFTKSQMLRSFDLVVGADGLQSQTRNLAWGSKDDSERVHRLGMYGAFFSMPRGGGDSEWRRWFRAPGRKSIMVRPDEQRDRSTVFAYVLNDSDSRLVDVAKRGPGMVQAQKELLKEYFQDVGWESERIIREMMVSDDFYYDMVAQVKMDKWSKGRVVLMGDAGYCASPISGMGTTLALTGAYHLAGAISRHESNLEAAFVEYEENMRPIVKKAQKLAPGFPHIFNPETAWGIEVLHAIVSLIYWLRLLTLLFRFIGSRAATVPVKEYGFEQPQELADDYDNKPKSIQVT